MLFRLYLQVWIWVNCCLFVFVFQILSIAPTRWTWTFPNWLIRCLRGPPTPAGWLCSSPSSPHTTSWSTATRWVDRIHPIELEHLQPCLYTYALLLTQRFIQYLASRNTLFNLSNFLDKSGLQGKGLIVSVFKYLNRNHKRNANCLIFLPPAVSGYDMSTFIRRYSRYLNEKAVSYRQVAFDFTKVKRG